MKYGGPKEELEEFSPENMWLSPDKKRLVVEVRNLKEGHVYHFGFMDTLLSAQKRYLLTPAGWYTLNQIADAKRDVRNWVQVLKRPTKAEVPVAKKAVGTPALVPLDPKAEAAAILEGSKLVQPSGCVACHKENEKVLGPAFRDVAKKYKSDLPTVKKLVEKVYNGGSGVWGDYAMAAQSHLKKDQIEKMVRWILSLK
jgi:cytochrome c